LAPEANALSN